MKNKRLSLAAGLFMLLLGSARASLVGIPGLFNTGVDATGAPLPDTGGAPDPHYTLIAKPAADPSTGAVVINHNAFPIGPWFGTNGSSLWIGAAPGAQAFGGTYVFQTSFNVPAALDPSKVAARGVWSTDDPNSSSIDLNGNPTGVAAPTTFGGFSPQFTISSGFLAGVNTLNFNVPDTAAATGGCCMGLRTEITLAYDVGLFNTGVDASRTVLGEDAVDSHWSITSGPTLGGPFAATSVGGFPIGPWLGDNTTSAWIGPATDTNGLEGAYVYETSFDLTGLDPSTFNIAGQMAVDNTITDILLNGVSTGLSGSGFGGWTPFSLTSASGNGFNSGVNTLEFLVTNGPGDGPTGLRVEFLDANGTIIPEPSGAILLALGGALLLRRRRK